MELKGTTAVITGSTGRLGRHIAIALARAGADCICHYYHNARFAGQLVEQITTLGRKASAVEADLSCESQVRRLFENVSDFGRAGILINSAAVFHKKPLTGISFEESQKVLAVNLTAALLTSCYFVEALGKNMQTQQLPCGKIINITDVGGIRPWAGYSVYCASKAALIAATKSLAKELAPAITVNAVAPGVITWPADSDDGTRQRQLSFIPAGRFGTPEEVASAVLFLLRNDYITGHLLCVDGGRSL